MARRDGLALACALALPAGACSSKAEPVADEPVAAAPGGPVEPSERAEPTLPAAPAVPLAPAVEAAARACTPCTPRILAEGVRARSLALDEREVFLVVDDALIAVDRTSGARRELARGLARDALALSADTVFACRREHDREVVRLAKTGGELVTVAQAGACRLVVAGDHLWFPALDPSGRRRLARVPLAGGVPVAIGALALELRSIHADATHVYWAEDDRLMRVPHAGDAPETVVANAPDLDEIVATATHVVWSQGNEIFRLPRAGAGTPELVANFQDVLDLATDGVRVYWSSHADRAWTRYDPGEPQLVRYAMPGGTSAIAVDGAEVVFDDAASEGRIVALDTCACGADVLVPKAAIRKPEPPASEDAVRIGYVDDDGKIDVQIEDLSPDEGHGIEQLAAANIETIALDDPRLPARLRDGTPFRVTTRAATSTGTIVAHHVGSGGSGTLYSVTIAAAGVPSGLAWVTRPSGPVIARIRDAVSDPEAVRRVLPAVRAAAKKAGVRTTIGRKHVVAVRGAFPKPHDMLVAVSIEADPADDASAGYVSALVLADTEGKITGELFELEDRLDTFEPIELVDVGDDGVDEVLFSSSYYEGEYSHLLQWNGDEPGYETLAGDGA